MTDEVDTAVIDAPATGEETAANSGELDLGYQVALDTFSGPLDLLLFLVRRSEVDIADIPIGLIADQFIAMLNATPELDLDVAGDFILMAATLLELKSRMVVPPEETAQGDDDQQDDDLIDPRAGLVRQLLAYRRFKEATQILPELELAHEQRSERRLREMIPEDPDEVDGLDLANCDVGQLYDCFETILVRINRLGPRTVINDDVPLEHKITSMIDVLRAEGHGTLRQFFARETTVVGRVGIVMATLECARQRFVEAKQHEQYGDVQLRYRDEAERTRAPELPPEPEEAASKRRRRPPLVTWHAAEQTEPVQEEIEEVEEEVVVESDEQRFLRELEESCSVTAVLGRTADLDASFIAFQEAQRLAAEAAQAAAEQAALNPVEETTATDAVPSTEDQQADEAAKPATTHAGRRKRARRSTATAPRPTAESDFNGVVSSDDDDDGFFDPDPVVDEADEAAENDHSRSS